MVVKAQTFKLESNRSQITFTQKGRANNMKINRLLYKTASSSNFVMLIIISGWSNGRTYNDIEYSRIQSLPRTTLTELDYESDSNNKWDIVKQPTEIGTHIIELYINGDTTNGDITIGNPCVID